MADMLTMRVKDLKYFMIRFFPLEERELACSHWFSFPVYKRYFGLLDFSFQGGTGFF